MSFKNEENIFLKLNLVMATIFLIVFKKGLFFNEILY